MFDKYLEYQLLVVVFELKRKNIENDKIKFF